MQFNFHILSQKELDIIFYVTVTFLSQKELSVVFIDSQPSKSKQDPQPLKIINFCFSIIF